MKWIAVALAVASPAAAEEIRIELLRGAREARLDSVRLAARGDVLVADGRAVPQPLVRGPRARLDGRALRGNVEVWAQRGSLVVVNELDLEDYVAAVVSSEMPVTWPKEALEAQAVAARTFAVAQKIAQGPAARAHLGASVLDQVCKDAAHPAPAALEAARATRGEVLTFGAAPIAAYFSASCGGRSESPQSAFHVDVPYLEGGVADEVEEKAPWSVRVRLDELSSAMRRAHRLESDIHSVAVASRTQSGRVRAVRLEGKLVDAIELRQILGYQRLPSLLFDVAQAGDAVIFTGRGSGHGVGLCQYGARGRAIRGERYQEILAHYYPGAEIRRMY